MNNPNAVNRPPVNARPVVQGTPRRPGGVAPQRNLRPVRVANPATAPAPAQTAQPAANTSNTRNWGLWVVGILALIFMCVASTLVAPLLLGTLAGNSNSGLEARLAALEVASQQQPVASLVQEAPAAEMPDQPAAGQSQSQTAGTGSAVVGAPQSNGEWPEDLFLSPVPQTDVISQETSWLIAEPGVLLDATATFDRGSSQPVHEIQCPEGGFAYISGGHGQLGAYSHNLSLEGAVGRNHLVYYRCRIDDGLQDTDLNTTIRFTEYTPGHILTSPMGTGAYISAHWMFDQLLVSAGLGQLYGLGNQSGGNCGASGCSETWVHLVDLNTGFEQLFIVDKDNINDWQPPSWEPRN